MNNTVLIDPVRLRLPEANEQLKKFLSFRDRSIDFQISRLRKNVWLRSSDPEAYLARMEELKAQGSRCLLFEDSAGVPWTYSGLWKDVEDRFGWPLAGREVALGCSLPVPWAKTPPDLRPYQEEAVAALEKAVHGAVSLPTGSGKSLILLRAARSSGGRCLIVTPSSAITRQLYADFVTYLGKARVGQYGDGKKEIGKQFTVAVAQSLVQMEPGTDAWDFFSKTETLLWDEAHTTPAETFEKVCLNLVSSAKRRYFVSATHFRSDGSEMVLRGITGPIVYTKSYSELVEQKYLSPLTFKVLTVSSHGNVNKQDPKKETRAQLYLNPNVNRVAAEIASKAVLLGGRQVLILIEEFKQFLQLRNFLKVQYEFVHGGVTKENREIVPKEYWECDVQETVKAFNEGKVRCLIGTSVISTGIDLRPVGCIIYLQGGVSEVKVRQAIGRGTRLVPAKNDCWVVDFKVSGSRAMERHVGERAAIYRDYGPVEEP